MRKQTSRIMREGERAHSLTSNPKLISLFYRCRMKRMVRRVIRHHDTLAVGEQRLSQVGITGAKIFYLARSFDITKPLVAFI